jgi:hypothetical protein
VEEGNVRTGVGLSFEEVDYGSFNLEPKIVLVILRKPLKVLGRQILGELEIQVTSILPLVCRILSPAVDLCHAQLHLPPGAYSQCLTDIQVAFRTANLHLKETKYFAEDGGRRQTFSMTLNYL